MPGANIAEIRLALETAIAASRTGSSDYDLNPDVTLPPGRKLRDAAVLICISDLGTQPQVILTKRSSRLKHHPGQIAFPGGKVDAGDADATETALREAQEEIGLHPSSVDVVGALGPHETVTGFAVVPVIGVLRAPFAPVAEAGEVEEVFNVPFAHVMDPGAFSVQSRIWRGQARSFYTVPWGPYYIWGATARMLRVLADHLTNVEA